tara:strand:- start:1341 stop:1559 length:219 start_codon:yes stop_codon:yes gene_type:complete
MLNDPGILPILLSILPFNTTNGKQFPIIGSYTRRYRLTSKMVTPIISKNSTAEGSSPSKAFEIQILNRQVLI